MLSTEITIRGIDKTYRDMFSATSTTSGQVIVNYTSETSELVDSMIATKTYNSNVVKGLLVQ